MRRAAKVDKSQPEIVRGLRAIGASVVVHQPSEAGEPDLFVGYRGRTYPLECKTPGHRTTGSAREHLAQQQRWRDRWRGEPVQVVETLDQAIRAVQARALGA